MSFSTPLFHDGSKQQNSTILANKKVIHIISLGWKRSNILKLYSRAFYEFITMAIIHIRRLKGRFKVPEFVFIPDVIFTVSNWAPGDFYISLDIS